MEIRRYPQCNELLVKWECDCGNGCVQSVDLDWYDNHYLIDDSTGEHNGGAFGECVECGYVAEIPGPFGVI